MIDASKSRMIEAKYLEIKRGNNVVGNVVAWQNIKKGDVCGWAEAVGTKRSGFISGEFGKNGSCFLEGSNDQINSGKLTSLLGVTLSFKSPNEFLEINEASRYVRPVIENADDDTDLTITIMVVL